MQHGVKSLLNMSSNHRRNRSNGGSGLGHGRTDAGAWSRYDADDGREDSGISFTDPNDHFSAQLPPWHDALIRNSQTRP